MRASGLSVRVSGHALRDLDAPAVRQVVRYPGGAKGVATYRSFDARIGCTAAHHVPDISARYHTRTEFLGFTDGSTEQRPLAVALDVRGLDISVNVRFQLVVTGHFIDLAVFHCVGSTRPFQLPTASPFMMSSTNSDTGSMPV